MLRHLEAKMTDCPVAADAGGFDVPRSVLLEIASKREYDGSRRCTGLAAVTKAVQQHRLMSTADARSFHMSALSTAHALMQLANHVLTEAAGAAAGADAAASCSQEVAHVMGALEERLWALQMNPGTAAPSSENACHDKAPVGDSVQLVQPLPDVPRYPCPV
jgi:hypothetical protein